MRVILENQIGYKFVGVFEFVRNRVHQQALYKEGEHMITKRKIQLIQQFLEVYRHYYFGVNCGIDIRRIQQLSEQQLIDRITDYVRLTKLRRI